MTTLALPAAMAAGAALPRAAEPAPGECAEQAPKCWQLAPTRSLTVGASARIRTFDYRPSRFGIGGDDDTYTLYRALVHADLRAGAHLQAFLQLGAHAESGRTGGPTRTDQSALDAQQGFVGWTQGAWSLRAGRQEMPYGSSRLISLRDGPNIRLAFDGARAIWQQAHYRVDAIAVRPVRNRPGAFDDEADTDQALWGLYATLTPTATAPVKADLYWLGYQRDGARFAIGTGDEYRQSFGTRLFGVARGWDWNTEAVYQMGRFRDQDIRAWTLATDTGYTFAAARWSPRLSLKADVASGDADAEDGRLETFNALYPNASYFSEASLLAPANLIDVQPALTLHPTDRFELIVGWDFVWKHHRADAVYTTPTPLQPVPGSAGTPRRVGDQIKLEASFRPNANWEIELHLARFNAGPALREAGGRDVDFASVAVSWQW